MASTPFPNTFRNRTSCPLIGSLSPIMCVRLPDPPKSRSCSKTSSSNWKGAPSQSNSSHPILPGGGVGCFATGTSVHQSRIKKHGLDMARCDTNLEPRHTPETDREKNTSFRVENSATLAQHSLLVLVTLESIECPLVEYAAYCAIVIGQSRGYIPHLQISFPESSSCSLKGDWTWIATQRAHAPIIP